jgi:hypothetical protein
MIPVAPLEGAVDEFSIALVFAFEGSLGFILRSLGFIVTDSENAGE